VRTACKAHKSCTQSNTDDASASGLSHGPLSAADLDSNIQMRGEDVVEPIDAEVNQLYGNGESFTVPLLCTISIYWLSN
jgi:hypothetical protein